MGDEPCPFCARPAPVGAETCPSCWRSLLVDLQVEAPLEDAHRRHDVARALWQMPGAPPFAELRERLRAPGILSSGLTRPTALALSEALREHGAAVRIEPHVPTSRPGARRWVLAAVLGSIAVLLAASAMAVVLLWPRHHPEAALEPPVAAAAPAPAPSAPAPAADIETIGRKAYAAIAEVSCKDKLGAGFFIDPETLVTNAHVLCADDDVQVRLKDGRMLAGSVVYRDPWVDLARVRVVGAGATPLEPGRSLALRAGDPVVFLGSPSGLSFTLHEARVGYVGRPYYGVAYIQLNGNVSPGNSGGPVLDREGKVVGIVTLKVTTAEAVGMALPIEYVVPPQGDTVTQWNALLQQVDEESRREAARFQLDYGVPMLVGMDFSRGDPVAVILTRWSSAPHGIVERIDVRRGPASVCSAQVTFTTWSALDAGAGDVGVQLRFLSRYGASREIYVGAGVVPAPCARTLYDPGEAVLVRPDGDHGKVRLEGDPDARNRLRQAQQVQAQQRRSDGAQEQLREAERERDWRKRFADAHERVSSIDREVDRAKREMRSMDASLLRHGAFRLGPQNMARYEEAKAVIDGADERRRKAEEDLAELERQASLDDVPQEWRR